jgi:hypothetical protein
LGVSELWNADDNASLQLKEMNSSMAMINHVCEAGGTTARQIGREHIQGK